MWFVHACVHERHIIHTGLAPPFRTQRERSCIIRRIFIIVLYGYSMSLNNEQAIVRLGLRSACFWRRHVDQQFYLVVSFTPHLCLFDSLDACFMREHDAYL